MAEKVGSSPEEQFVAALVATQKFGIQPSGDVDALGFDFNAVWGVVKVVGKGIVSVLFKNDGLKHIAEAVKTILRARMTASVHLKLQCPGGQSMDIEAKQPSKEVEQMMLAFARTCKPLKA